MTETTEGMQQALERIACHEAGHVVVALFVRPLITFDSVTIISDSDAAGHVAGMCSSILFPEQEYGEGGKEKELRAHAAVACGGPMAEFLWERGPSDDDKPSKVLIWGAGHDFDGLEEIIKELGGEDPKAQEAHRHEAHKTALDILNDNWELFGAIASALLEKKTLSWSEVLAIATGGDEHG